MKIKFRSCCIDYLLYKVLINKHVTGNVLRTNSNKHKIKCSIGNQRRLRNDFFQK